MIHTKKCLSPGRMRLLRLMQDINFGTITDLQVSSGEPQFEPPPKVTAHIKIGGVSGPRPELDSSDFALKTQLIEFFAHLDRLKDATLKIIEVRHGLPVHMVIEVQP